ncbi:tetratricopeptide repeat protein [Wolbachia endosymbiont of Pentidionis agamae]|uniref:tetratricopeptide repeat protein n=1 Tax=Wolbachia endosymbiont of Pentidionis agamae TaxID=3110435 RepID=UPI002FD1759D
MLRALTYTFMLLISFRVYGISDTRIQEVFSHITEHMKSPKNAEESIDILEKVSNKFDIKVTNNSESLSFTLERANNALKQGDALTALDLFNKIIARFPNHKNALVGLGNIYYANKQYEQAVQIYLDLLDTYSDDKLLLANFLTLISEYNIDLALTEMLKLHKIMEKDSFLLANLGLVYAYKNDLEKAKYYMLSAVSLDQENALYIYNLAVILDKLSDFKNAATFYKKFLDQSNIILDDLISRKQVAKRLKTIKKLVISSASLQNL